MKSIKSRLLITFTVLILILTVGLGFTFVTVVSQNLIDGANADLKEMAKLEAKYIQASMNTELKYIDALAQNIIITDETISSENKIQFFESEAKRSDYILFGFADKNGKATILNSNNEKNDIQDNEFFQKAIKGESSFSDLIFNEVDENPVIVFASPVYNSSGQITGVLFGKKDGFMLSKIISEISYRKTGYAYMVNNQGNTVGHTNTDLVLAKDNDIENAKTDKLLQQLGDLTVKMVSREIGSGDYTYNGVNKIVGYAPVEGAPWIVAFGIKESEILEETQALKTIVIIACIIALLIGALVTFFVSNNIAKPIIKVTDVAEMIANGNFEVDLSINSKDEIGLLAKAFNSTIEKLVNYQAYIDEISNALLSVAEGNLTFEPKMEYVGQFQKLKDNMIALTESLNSTLLKINQTALQVDNGAEQVSNGAQALSQGATEQASSIEELSASISEVTEQIKQNAENAKSAGIKSDYAGKELQNSNVQMKDMVSAMELITTKSFEISKIIKIIDDIAFQTNILALNAAVEAARAGMAGKGFAVVADEVRNLAGKSAEAAKNTTNLIAETIQAVENGSKIVNKTSTSLEKTAQITIEAVQLIDKIDQASQGQATAIVEISQGIEQVSLVIQTNAATAEESAATSEELSSQSNILKELIAKFKIREN